MFHFRLRLWVPQTLTGDSGYVLQSVLINAGEQRLWGVILYNMAALAYKTGSTLYSSKTKYIC